jgi:hypothetical protein
MKRIAQFFTVMLLLTFHISTASAWTDVSSLVNHDVPFRRFEKVLVIAAISELETRQAVESKLNNELSERCDVGGSAKSIDLFFPGETYSSEQVASKIQANGVDAILVFQITGLGSINIQLPQTTTTNTSGSVTGNTFSGHSTTTTYNNNFSQPNASYTVSLYSVKDGKNAWYATANAKGSVFSNIKSLSTGMANKAIDKLLDDGVIKRK